MHLSRSFQSLSIVHFSTLHLSVFMTCVLVNLYFFRIYEFSFTELLHSCRGLVYLKNLQSTLQHCTLWQWFQLEIRLNAFHRSTIPQKQLIINIIIIIIIIIIESNVFGGHSYKGKACFSHFHTDFGIRCGTFGTWNYTYFKMYWKWWPSTIIP